MLESSDMGTCLLLCLTSELIELFGKVEYVRRADEEPWFCAALQVIKVRNGHHCGQDRSLVLEIITSSFSSS